MTKAELRKIYLAARRSLSQDERTKKSKQIAQHFFERFDLSQIKFLHCFIAIERFNEVDTSLIFQRLWKEFPNITTVVPRVDFEMNEIKNLKFSPDTNLVENIWEIHEPSHDEYIETRKIDMVLVPLLCFDAAGYRVGYGKGFYDRFLINCREDCVKIGLSYFKPVEKIENAGDHDIKLDFSITSENVFTAETQRLRVK